MAGCIVDITEKKRLADLKHEFVYIVTHELRTPLTALKGALDVLTMLMGKDLPRGVENMLDLAMQGSNRLMVLINDLLEVGKAESGAMQFHCSEQSVEQLLQNAIDTNKPYADKNQVTFDLKKPKQDSLINVDPGRFMQIMTNLLSNAAKFSRPEDIVSIETEIRNGRVIISVTDHGRGIPEDFQSKIFQKFAQASHGIYGTGLGLSITKTMLEKMQGRIWFTSEAEKGSVFYLEFPQAI